MLIHKVASPRALLGVYCFNILLLTNMNNTIINTVNNIYIYSLSQYTFLFSNTPSCVQYFVILIVDKSLQSLNTPLCVIILFHFILTIGATTITIILFQDIAINIITTTIRFL